MPVDEQDPPRPKIITPLLAIKKIVDSELILVNILFISMLSICYWHANGQIGVLGYQIQWTISNNVFIISLILLALKPVKYIVTTKFLKFTFIPYFCFKMIYNILIFTGVNIGTGKVWEIIWSFVCIAIILQGAYFTARYWKKLNDEVFKNITN